jgi:hypothetical protein
MKELAKYEYLKLCKRLQSDAVSLASQTPDTDYSAFYSSSPVTCAYGPRRKTPKTFRSLNNDYRLMIYHFLDTPCEKVLLSCKKTAVCVCRDTRDPNQTRYYTDTHLVGRCPWKTCKGETR